MDRRPVLGTGRGTLGPVEAEPGADLGLPAAEEAGAGGHRGAGQLVDQDVLAGGERLLQAIGPGAHQELYLLAPEPAEGEGSGRGRHGPQLPTQALIGLRRAVGRRGAGRHPDRARAGAVRGPGGTGVEHVGRPHDGGVDDGAQVVESGQVVGGTVVGEGAHVDGEEAVGLHQRGAERRWGEDVGHGNVCTHDVRC